MADPVTEFEAYRAELLAALGSDDPVAVLQDTLEEIPRLVQDAWTARFGDLDADAHETVARWASLRHANVRMYASLSASELQRVGLHSERGEASALLNIQLLAGHDRMHLDQFRCALGR